MIHKSRILLAVPFMFLAVFFKAIFLRIIPANSREEARNLI